jgi:hypothetical protein
MLAYRAHLAVTKAAMLAEAESHRDADRFKTGSFGTCAIGCAAQSLVARTGLAVDNDDHTTVANLQGWPEWLAHAEDTIFETLPHECFANWPVEIVEAIPDGADLSGVRDAWLALVLRRVVLPIAGTAAGVVERIAAGLETGWMHDDQDAARQAAWDTARAGAYAFATGENVASYAAYAAANAAKDATAWDSWSVPRGVINAASSAACADAIGSASRTSIACNDGYPTSDAKAVLTMAALLLDCLAAAPVPARAAPALAEAL